MSPGSLQFLFLMFAGWVNREQQAVIEYMLEERRVLLEQAGGKRKIARNLTDPIDGFLRDARYLIHDADPLFTDEFKQILRPPGSNEGEGVECVKIPPRSPNCNPHAERFVKSIKYECLNRFVFFGGRHLRYVIKEYMAYYHEDRFHQGIGSRLIRPASANDNAVTGGIRCRSRLGGLLNFYYREAA